MIQEDKKEDRKKRRSRGVDERMRGKKEESRRAGEGEEEGQKSSR